MFKVRYIKGAGVELAVPVGGLTSFSSGIDYEIEDVKDFLKLVTGPDPGFEAVEIDESLIDPVLFKKGLIIAKTAEPVKPAVMPKVEDSKDAKETNV